MIKLAQSSLIPAPAQVIGADGRPIFGRYAGAAQSISPQGFDYRRATGKPAGRLARWWGFKQFEYFGVISEQLLFGCALANLRHSTVVFCYLYQPQTQLLKEFTFKAPLAWGGSNSESPISGLTRFKWGGCEAEFSYRDQPRIKSLRLTTASLKAELSMDESAANFEPMSLTTQIGRNGWVYAHKVAAVPVSGWIESEGKRYDLSALNAYGHHDFSAGYMRRETFWNWACFSGELADGQPVGLNISCGVNETSFSENCFWLAGRCYPVGLARFDYNRDDPMQPWRVTTGCEAVQLEFMPEGLHKEKINFGIVASDFKQVFGRFAGTIRSADGELLSVTNQYGFVEDQYAKW